jgi:predicted metal-dependent hydrolase
MELGRAPSGDTVAMRRATLQQPGGPSPERRIVTIGGLDVCVRVSARRRTVGLTIERDATVTASVPPEVDDAALASIVTAKQSWLYAKLRDRAETGIPRAPRQFVSGEGFPYLGRSYRLLVVDESSGIVALERGRLRLRSDGLANATSHLVRWYKAAGEPWLRRRIAPWAQRMGIEAAALRVRPLGYRWGSCTGEGAISIHWATMQLPPDLIDYVLVHELAHVRHPDHGTEFWLTVDRAMPGYEVRRARLKQVGSNLWIP